MGVGEGEDVAGCVFQHLAAAHATRASVASARRRVRCVSGPPMHALHGRALRHLLGLR